MVYRPSVDPRQESVTHTVHASHLDTGNQLYKHGRNLPIQRTKHNFMLINHWRNKKVLDERWSASNGRKKAITVSIRIKLTSLATALASLDSCSIFAVVCSSNLLTVASESPEVCTCRKTPQHINGFLKIVMQQSSGYAYPCLLLLKLILPLCTVSCSFFLCLFLSLPQSSGLRCSH